VIDFVKLQRLNKRLNNFKKDLKFENNVKFKKIWFMVFDLQETHQKAKSH